MTGITWRLVTVLGIAAPVLTIVSFSADSKVGAEPPRPARDPQIGQSFQIPYRLTDTNHFLVRVRINGKGPFNFLVDSGAPALFIATETAKKIGLKPDAGKFWTPIDQLDLEGGSRLIGVKARVEDPFQLVGMNALGLPGASIDGILGFTILARFCLEIDLTKDRMTWTRLDHDPRDPPVPDHRPGDHAAAPAGVQAMSVLGPLAKGLAFLMGKQPEEQRQPRGFLGLEWSEQLASGRKQVWVKGLLDGLPAAQAGVQTGDQIVKIGNREIEDLKAARSALSEVHPGDKVALVVRRGPGTNARELKLVLTAAEGL
jgi:Aspartyl protease/PDZ domain